MIHVFPTSGGHQTFDQMKTFTTLEEVVTSEESIVWISPAFVAWKQNRTQFIMLPWAKVDNVHIIRKTGDDWLSASGG